MIHVFPGGILVPQTFGDMANWNPHVHALITDTYRDSEHPTCSRRRSQLWAMLLKKVWEVVQGGSVL